MADNLWDKFLKAVFKVRETSVPPISEPVISLAEEYVNTPPSIWEQEITLTPPAEAPELAAGQEYLDRQMTYALQKNYSEALESAYDDNDMDAFDLLTHKGPSKGTFTIEGFLTFNGVTYISTQGGSDCIPIDVVLKGLRSGDFKLIDNTLPQPMTDRMAAARREAEHRAEARSDPAAHQQETRREQGHGDER